MSRPKDRPVLIRLAAAFPKGSPERRTILAALQKQASYTWTIEATGDPKNSGFISSPGSSFAFKYRAWVRLADKIYRSAESRGVRHIPLPESRASEDKGLQKVLSDARKWLKKNLTDRYGQATIQITFKNGKWSWAS